MIGHIYFHKMHRDVLRIREAGPKDYGVDSKRRGKWYSYGSFTKERLEKECIFMGKNEDEAEQFVKDGKALVEGGFQIKMTEFKALEEGHEFSESTAIMERPSTLLGILASAETKHRMVEHLQNKMLVAVEHQRMELDRILDEAKAVVNKMMEKVGEIQRVVRTIELYAGINEDLVQIQEGFNAPEQTPLSLRQLVIFMDEEVGSWRNDGFDYSNVEDFDEWLKDPKNLNRVCPDLKCVVAFRPRRKSKEYNDPVANAVQNQWNRETYFLIRNGSNLYRIFTENLQLGKKMFLGAQEMTEKLSPEDLDLYRRQAMFIQGLIDRTDVFKPVPSEVNIFKPNTYQGWLKLVFDYDGVLTDGRPSFKEWKEEVNSLIQVGSRVAVSPTWLEGMGSRRDIDYIMNERTQRNYASRWNCPKPPFDPGVVTTEPGFTGWDFSFKYFPGGETHSWTGSSERKNKISFGFDRSDLLLNYDAISLDEVEYYLNDRRHRESYVTMLPLLESIKQARLKEIEWEGSFVRLIQARTGHNPETIWEVVEWWKLKNKWKRPIIKDDAKAIRMIEKRLKSHYFSNNPSDYGL